LSQELNAVEQLNQLAGQIARHIRISSRPLFAIVEMSEGDHLPWPASESSTGHEPFVDAVSRKLASNGVWCCLELDPEGAVLATLSTSKNQTRSTKPQSHDPRLQSGRELGKIIASDDKHSICKLLTILNHEFEWVGFYVTSNCAAKVPLLLKHCESVMIAASQRTTYGRQQHRQIEAWVKSGVAIKAAFQVAA
jgi:hypothetical protein